MWVTSNLLEEGPVSEASGSEKKDKDAGTGAAGLAAGAAAAWKSSPVRGDDRWRRWGLRRDGRRWDWCAVGLKCVLPAGVVYVVMAWAEALRREWGCMC